MRSDWNEKVKWLLDKFPDDRDDDFHLYLDVIKEYTDAPVWAMSFEEAMINHVRYGFPSYESVTRARRKVQELNPHLRGNKYQMRKDKQEEYREEYGRW